MRHCLPGERVLAAVTQETRSYLRADAVEIIRSSPARAASVIARPGQCGGCDWQHIAPEAQRKLKADLVIEQLRRLAGVGRRRRGRGGPAALTGSAGGLVSVSASTKLVSRLHKHRSHELQPLERCLIASATVEALRSQSREMALMSRTSRRSRSAKRSKASCPSRRRRRRLEHLPEIDAGLVVNGRVARQPESLVFEVLKRRYEVSAGVFWQVHPGAAEVLGRCVLAGLEPGPGDRVADLYAGAGLFAGLLGDAVAPGGSVLAVERDRWACSDAARNTADQPQVSIFKAAVTPALVTHRLGGVNLMVLDPSREGAGRAVMESLAALRPGPRRIVYVACDPASFARDLRVLLDAGWHVSSLRAFDMFPMTEHVEVVAVLESPHVRATNAL